MAEISRDAAREYVRILSAPMGDPQITAAALLGLGEARYRTDDDAGALANWQSVTQLPETSSTYPAWRNVAAAQVRAGDLQSAFASYKEADRRAPPQDKAEIANRLGWLSKELGNQGAANRYFAKGRGDVFQITLTKVIIAVTVVISLTVYLTQDSPEGQQLLTALWLDKAAVAGGEYWRLWTVTLVHADWLHLAFNMWALWIVGPLVERWYGPLRFLVFYLACAATGSVASFAFGGDAPSVGASGAIFGMFGVIAAASWIHHPVDRYARAIARQIGVLILINLAFGFASAGDDRQRGPYRRPARRPVAGRGHPPEPGGDHVVLLAPGRSGGDGPRCAAAGCPAGARGGCPGLCRSRGPRIRHGLA